MKECHDATEGEVAAIREVSGQPAKDIKVRYYISSAKLSAKELLEASVPTGR